jgi:hypothetical protein
MIDTDKYTGHAREEWHRDSNYLWFHRNGEDIQIADILIRGDGDERYYEDVANARLITDAPLFLEEVKRLSALADALWKLIPSYLSTEATDVWNEHMGDEEE